MGERSFDLADSVEKGLAREVSTEFLRPLPQLTKLCRFNVIRSANKLQYHLFSDAGDFMMFARIVLDARRVEFFLYDPNDARAKFYNPARPAFTMCWSEDGSEWRLVQERCERCQLSMRRLSCACCG